MRDAIFKMKKPLVTIVARVFKAEAQCIGHETSLKRGVGMRGHVWACQRFVFVASGWLCRCFGRIGYMYIILYSYKYMYVCILIHINQTSFHTLEPGRERQRCAEELDEVRSALRRVHLEAAESRRAHRGEMEGIDLCSTW